MGTPQPPPRTTEHHHPFRATRILYHRNPLPLRPKEDHLSALKPLPHAEWNGGGGRGIPAALENICPWEHHGPSPPFVSAEIGRTGKLTEEADTYTGICEEIPLLEIKFCRTCHMGKKPSWPNRSPLENTLPCKEHKTSLTCWGLEGGSYRSSALHQLSGDGTLVGYVIPELPSRF